MNALPADYLDKIAPKEQKRRLFELNLRNIIILAVAAIGLVVAIGAIANSIGARATSPWQQLSLRLTHTEAMVDSAGKLIKNSQLRSYNSDIKLYITNTKRDLSAPFASVGVTPKSTPVAITASEKKLHDDMTQRLEVARLNVKYDSTYAREMSYQLSTLLALYQQLYTSSSPATQQLLETAYNNLEPTQKALAEFSDANE